MLSTVRRLLSPCLTALVVGLTALPAWAANPTPSDRLLPPGVLMYFSVPSVQEFQERYSKTGFGELIHDPAMAEIKEEVMDAIEKVSKQIEDEIGVSLEELYSIPSGEVAFALTPIKGREFGGAIFFDFGTHKEQFETLLDKMDEALDDQNWTKSTDSFDGTEIVTWKNPRNGDGPASLSYFVKDTLFVASNLTSLLEGTLDRWDGKHNRVFADDEVYNHIMKRCSGRKEGEAAAYWFVNPISLLQSGMALAGQNGGGVQVGMISAFLPILGIDKLRGMGGTIDMSTEDFDVEGRTLLYVDQPVSGVFNFFSCPAVAPVPPALLSADIAAMSAMNWDAQRAYKAVEETVDKFQGPGSLSRLLDQLENNPNGPGLHPKRDFIDQLAGGVYMIQNPNKPDQPEAPQVAILLGVKDEAKMQKVVDKLLTMDGVGVVTRDFRGTKIYEPEETGTPIKPAMAIAKGYLIISFDVEMLETILRGEAQKDSLATSEPFKAVAKWFPKEVSVYAFQRQDKMMEGYYEIIKKGLADQDEFDVSKLPEFDAIRKYFGLVGGYYVPDDHGVFMMSFGLKPAI